MAWFKSLLSLSFPLLNPNSVTCVSLTDSDFLRGVQPKWPFKWDQDSCRWWLLPLTFPSVPPASSLTSCRRTSVIHISLRIQRGVSGSRLGLGTLINQSRTEVAWGDFIQSCCCYGSRHVGCSRGCFSFLFAWTETSYVCFRTPGNLKLASKWMNQKENSSIHSWKTCLLLRGPVTGRKPGLTWEKLMTNRGRKHLRAPQNHMREHPSVER